MMCMACWTKWSNDQIFQNNIIIGHPRRTFFELNQISSNIESNNIRWPNMVVKRSNISPNLLFDEILGKILSRFIGA